MVCDFLQKIELLHAAGTQITPPNGQEIVKTLYDILNVLDNKGLALLAFDGIIVAATTFAAEKGGVFHKRGLARWLAILSSFYRSARPHYVYSFPKSRIHSCTMLTAAHPPQWIFPARSIILQL